MKHLLTLFVFLFLSASAFAANTPPPGNTGQFVYNNSNKWAAGTFGSGLTFSDGTLTSSGSSSPSIGGTITGGINGDFLYVNPSATLAQLAPSQIRGLPPNQWSTMNAYGDQATYYSFYTPLNQVWPTLINNNLNGSLNLYNDPFAFDCDIVDAEIMPNSKPGNYGNPVTAWLPSVNDPTYGAGGVAAHEAITHQCRIAGLTWMSIPASSKIYGQNSACVQTGTWANDTAYGGSYGVISSTNGSTLTCTISTNGGPVYFLYKLHDSDGGTFTYSVDGGAASASIPTNAGNQFSYPVDGTHHSVAGIRLPVAAGTHTVAVTVTSSTSGSNTVGVVGLETPPGKVYLGGGPTVFYGGQIYELSGSDPYAAQATAFNTDQLTDAYQLFSDGLPVNFVNVRQYVNATTDMAASGGGYLVPNAIGQQHIADAFQGVMQMEKNPLISGTVDPRNYGASCNAVLFRTDVNGTSSQVTTTASSNVISISNYSFTALDVGKFIAISGNGGDLGLGVATITSVNTGANTATISLTPTGSATNSFAVMGADDTTGFHNASIVGSATGQAVTVPDGCAVRSLTLANGSTLRGSLGANGYGYFLSTTGNGTSILSPRLYILSTGYVSDGTNYGIDVTGGYAIALQGFTITTATYPVLSFTGMNLACVGSTNGTGGSGPNETLLLDHMTIQFCPIGVGVAATVTPTGHIFMQSHFSEYADNGWGWRFPGSDVVSLDDVFTGNFTGGMDMGPQGTGGYAATAYRVIGTRYEENGVGVYCDACQGNHFEGAEWQFNNGYDLVLNGQWNNDWFTGGFMEGNGSVRANVELLGFGNFTTTSAVFENVYAAGDTYFIDNEGNAGGENPTIVYRDGLLSYNPSTNFVYTAGTGGVLYGYDAQPANWPRYTFGILNGSFDNGNTFTTSGCSVSAHTGGSKRGTFTLGTNSCTAVITINGSVGLTAPHGYICQAHDRTAPTVLIGGESSSTTTTASFTIPAGAGVTDVISFGCEGY